MPPNSYTRLRIVVKAVRKKNFPWLTVQPATESLKHGVYYSSSGVGADAPSPSAAGVAETTNGSRDGNTMS